MITMEWTNSENQIRSFINEIKFNFKYPKDKIEFLDNLIYKDHENLLQTTL